MDVSIIIRTLNESKYLPKLLVSLENQKSHLKKEIILIDSGSTDGTVGIAKHHGCKILTISKEEFSFGRSLNRACEKAQGQYLAIISGHCIPCDNDWLNNLLMPLINKVVQFTYGRQIGGEDSFYSEKKIFEKYFPNYSKIPQEGFYCNNANSALSTEIWNKYKFDENLTGLEDMYFCKELTKDGGLVGYVAEACVLHLHHENGNQIKKRFEREAYALQKIYPNLNFQKRDFLKCFLSGAYSDIKSTLNEGKLNFRSFQNIINYRFNQYLGSLIGNKIKDPLTHKIKESYFYPANNFANKSINKLPIAKKSEENSQKKFKVIALLPMKANSERIPNKNFKQLHFKPLFKWILDVLISIDEIELIVINTDAREKLENLGILDCKKVLIRDRKQELRGDFTSMNKIINDDIHNIDSEIYLMTHTTNPLLSKDTIKGALESYKKNKKNDKFDSLFTVNDLKTRLYKSNGRPLNHNPNKLQRTQDLESLYEENSNLYIFSKESFINSNSRIGKNPFMYVSPSNESIDIDNYQEWFMTEAMLKYRENN